MSSYYYEDKSSFSMSSRRPVTYAVQRLIIANVIVFAVGLILYIPLGDPFGNPLHPEFWMSFNPHYVRYGALWQFVSYTFLHAGLLHLCGNMFGLYFFGPDVERILSTRQFFKFYFLCGAVGALFHFGLYLLTGSRVPVVGASGATLGIAAAFAVAYPKRTIVLFPIPIPIYAWALVALMFVFSFTVDASSPATAWAVHVGGMVCGFLYMKYTPAIRTWFERRAVTRSTRKDAADPLGDAVDNIFKFDDEKKKRK